jgi:hypothetical protein
MLSFPPKPENELLDFLEIGDGQFEVVDATSKLSKSSGNPMIELKLKVWDVKGKSGVIYDYLMLNEHNFSLRKIRHFCYSAGLGGFYEAGKLDAPDCIGRQGKCNIGIQKGSNGYQDKNVINDYLEASEQVLVKPLIKADDKEFDDDIPF